jgi:hypothetical protein
MPSSDRFDQTPNYGPVNVQQRTGKTRSDSLKRRDENGDPPPPPIGTNPSQLEETAEDVKRPKMALQSL